MNHAPKFTFTDFMLIVLTCGLLIVTILSYGHARQIDRLKQTIYRQGR